MPRDWINAVMGGVRKSRQSLRTDIKVVNDKPFDVEIAEPCTDEA